MSVDVVGLRALAEKATRGPWKWTGHRVSTLEGRAGDPESYEYDVEVIEAEHYGECGCRSACTLDLIVKQVDADYIAAANPSVVLALLDEITTLRAEVADRDARITAALKLHNRGPTMYASAQGLVSTDDDHIPDGCDYCQVPWPCLTVRTLSAPAVPVPQDNPEATDHTDGDQ